MFHTRVDEGRLIDLTTSVKTGRAALTRARKGCAVHSGDMLLMTTQRNCMTSTRPCRASTSSTNSAMPEAFRLRNSSKSTSKTHSTPGVFHARPAYFRSTSSSRFFTRSMRSLDGSDTLSERWPNVSSSTIVKPSSRYLA